MGSDWKALAVTLLEAGPWPGLRFALVSTMVTTTTKRAVAEALLRHGTALAGAPYVSLCVGVLCFRGLGQGAVLPWPGDVAPMISHN